MPSLIAMCWIDLAYDDGPSRDEKNQRRTGDQERLTKE